MERRNSEGRHSTYYNMVEDASGVTYTCQAYYTKNVLLIDTNWTYILDSSEI